MGHLEGSRSFPRIDKALLRAHSEGLVALSGGCTSEVVRLSVTNGLEAAAAAARKSQSIFGRGCFFLELVAGDGPEAFEVNARVCEVARRTGIPLVATVNCQYLDAEDGEAHRVLCCINLDLTESEVARRDRFNTPLGEATGSCLRSPDEMRARFAGVPEAIENTALIAKVCNVTLDLGRQKWPSSCAPSSGRAWPATPRGSWTRRRRERPSSTRSRACWRRYACRAATRS